MGLVKINWESPRIFLNSTLRKIKTMHLKRLSLSNFKCFEQVDIDLGKITVLTGANSSGKSSLLYGILGPLQSPEFPLQYSANGNYVNMGDFREVFHKEKADEDSRY